MFSIRFPGLLFAAAISIALAAPYAFADIFDDYDESNESFDFTGEVGVMSRRFFRGQDLYDRTSIQPRLRAQANIDIFSLYIEGFSHIETEDSDDPDKPKFSELDYDLGGLVRMDILTLHLGHRWYSYSEETARLDNTGEFFTKLQFDTFGQPFIEVDYDWDTYRGWYGELGAEAPVPIGSGENELSLIPFATLGWSANLDDGERPIYDENGAVAIDVGIRSEIKFAEWMYLEPEIQYSAGLDDAADDTFLFGIRIGARGSAR